MREIKFRFWGPFGDWEEPDEMEQKKTMLYGDHYAWEENEPINDLFAGLEYADVIPMQFTGLLDRNGKEIYEGDIVQCDQMLPALVAWDNDHSWYMFGDMVAGEHVWPIEVIGNIYENPELLEAKP